LCDHLHQVNDLDRPAPTGRPMDAARLLGGDGPSAVVGALGGAAIGAAASQGSSESRSYEGFVRYDDGGYQVFVWNGYCPFRPGEPVMLTPHGLSRM
jgi:outer membrane lipoprotein SlyB